MAETALDQRARQMRLNLSNEEVARQIMADPSFKGPSGQFERARFEAIIRNAGYNEPRFAAEQKKLTLRRELAETVSGGFDPPKTLEQAYNRYENEQRAIDYVTLDRAKRRRHRAADDRRDPELFRRAEGCSSARPNTAAS